MIPAQRTPAHDHYPLQLGAVMVCACQLHWMRALVDVDDDADVLVLVAEAQRQRAERSILRARKVNRAARDGARGMRGEK